MTGKKRNIRIFISSTFRDMMDEREQLMKIVFPELRRRCARKFIELTEVDLRWGVTDEEASQGRVIEICLNEIDKSRPYFIGILGNRYGWVPTMVDFEKCKHHIERFPWVNKDVAQGLSITEMEIQYGVLRNPNMSGKAFFYLKEFHEEDQDDAREKLITLRKKIESQNLFPVKKYKSAESMGNQVLNDLWKQIEIDYPDEEIPDEHTREQLNHQAILHKHTAFFAGNHSFVDQLNQIVTQNNLVLLSGQPGIGKTTLLTNYLEGHLNNSKVVYYSCGASERSSRLENVIFFITEELKRLFDIPYTIPKKIENPKDLLTAFIKKVPQEIPLCLILDGLEHIITDDDNNRLQWLPDEIPTHVKVIISDSSATHLELLVQKGYQVFELQDTPPEAIREITVKYFELFSKKLPNDLLDAISAFNLSGKPLVLLTMLNELRTFGIHEQLHDFIGYYTQAESIDQFFNLFVQHLQHDFENEKYNLKGVLSSILLSQKGLSENEITQINGISALNWSQIQNALNQHLVNKNGFLSFANHYIKSAIKNGFLNSSEQNLFVLKSLTSYFNAQYEKLKDSNESEQLLRILEELPQLAIKSGNKDVLQNILSHIPSIILLFKKRQDSLARLISAIKDFGEPDEILSQGIKSFANKCKDADLYLEAFFTAGVLVAQHQSAYKATPFFEKALRSYLDSTNHSAYIIPTLQELSRIYSQTGAYKTSIQILERMLPALSDEDIAETFDLLAGNYAAIGNFQVAEFMHEDALSFFTHRYGDRNIRVAIQQNNLARLYDVYKDYEKAEAYYLKAADTIRYLSGPENPIHQSIQSNIGLMYMNNQRLNEAETIFNEVLTIRRAQYGKKHRLTLKTMNSIGVCQSLKGNYNKAMEVLTETLLYQMNLLGNHHSDTLITQTNIADIHEKTGNFEEAIHILSVALDNTVQHYGELNEKTINTLMALSDVYAKSGNKVKAEETYLQTINLQKQFYGDNNPLTLYTQDKLSRLNQPDKSEPDPSTVEESIGQLMKEAVQLAENGNPLEAAGKYKLVVDLINTRLNGNHPGLFESLSQLSAIHHQEMEYQAAAAYASQLLDIVSQFLPGGHEAILEFSVLKAFNLYKMGDYNNMTQILFDLNDYEEQLFKFPKKYIENMYREMRGFLTEIMERNQRFEKEQEQFSQHHQQLSKYLEEGITFYEADDLTQALAQMEKAVDLALKISDDYALVFEKPFEYKAFILEQMEKRNEALQTIHAGLETIQRWHSVLDTKNFNLLKQAGDMFAASDASTKAINYYQMAQKVNKNDEDYPNRKTIDLNMALTVYFADQEAYSKALSIIQQTIPLSEKLLGMNDETTLWFKDSLKQLQN